jgi:flagella basal body P-ring formation protein FlgA
MIYPLCLRGKFFTKEKCKTLLFFMQFFLIPSICLAYSNATELGPLEYKISNLLKTSIGDECSRVKLTLNQKSVISQLEKTSIRDLKLVAIDAKAQSFIVNVVASHQGHNITLSGSYQCLSSIPTLSRAVKAGRMIEENNVKLQDVDTKVVNMLSHKLAKKPEEMVGMCAKQDIKANSFVYLSQLKNQLAVHINDSVEIVCVGGNFAITTIGRAIQSGAIGDRIRVQNTKSKKILIGRISANKTVEVEE